MSRYRYTDGASAPVFRNQFIFGQFLFYTVDIGTWLIDLVDRNYDLDAEYLRDINGYKQNI